MNINRLKFFQFLIKYKYQILFWLIILIAVFFRFYEIQSIPPGLYPDEAINGNDALNALKNRNFKVFYLNNNGREGLFINLIALAIKLFGAKIWALRIVSAFFGVLTVWGLYLLVKKILDEKIALFSSFFLAVSFWHINFSRIAFRAILVPFFTVFAFYFLFLAFDSKKIRHYIFSGIFFGLGFYTYIAFRFIYVILAIVLIVKFIEYWQKNKPKILNFDWWWNIFYKKHGWWKIDIFFLTILLVMLPLGLYFFQNPQDFFGRSKQVSIFSQNNIFLAFVKSTALTLSMFNFHGDANWRHNYSSLPQLLWPIGILFLIGIIIVFKNLILSLRSNSNLNFWVFIISGFFIMLLPSILTYEGLPHALRTIGSIPFVFIFVGLGLDFLYKKLRHFNLKYLNTIFVIFFLLIMAANFNKYFLKWGKNPEVKGAFSQNLVDIGKYLLKNKGSNKIYVIINMGGVLVDNLPMPVQTIKFVLSKYWPQNLETTKNIIYLMPEDLNTITFYKNDKLIPLAEDINIFEELKLKYPKGEIIKKDRFSIFIAK